MRIFLACFSLTATSCVLMALLMLTACEEEESKGRGEQRKDNGEHKSAHNIYLSIYRKKKTFECQVFDCKCRDLSTFPNAVFPFPNHLGGKETNVFSRMTDPFSTQLVFKAAADRPAAQQPKRQTTVSANDTFAITSICPRLTCRIKSPFQIREKQKKKTPFLFML